MNATAPEHSRQPGFIGPARPTFADLPEHLQKMATGEAPMSEDDRALIRNLLLRVAHPARPSALAPPPTPELAAELRALLPPVPPPSSAAR